MYGLEALFKGKPQKPGRPLPRHALRNRPGARHQRQPSNRLAKRRQQQPERVGKYSRHPYASGMSEHTPSIADLRKSYQRAERHEAASHADPLKQFEQWINKAIAAQLPEPDAMTPLRHVARRALVEPGLGPDPARGRAHKKKGEPHGPPKISRPKAALTPLLPGDALGHEAAVWRNPTLDLQREAIFQAGR